VSDIEDLAQLVRQRNLIDANIATKRVAIVDKL
jgi:hypothetical protein